MRWPLVTLEKVSSRIRNGLSIKQTPGAGGLPITRIETISNATIDPNRLGYAGINNGERSDWYLKPGEILFSHINSEERIGNCALYEGVPNPLVHGMNLLCLTPDESKITPKYLLYVLNTRQFRQSLKPIIKRAVNQASVSIDNLKNIGIPLPPLSEQRRIVKILDQADALRKKRAEADAKAARILPALFYKMFGDPATNPKGWEQKPFDDTFDDCTAKFPKLQQNAYQQVGQFPVIDQGKELIAGYIDNESLVTAVDQPVIVFGDHTRVVKLVDFAFVAGADGSRVFMAKKGFIPAFLACQLELQPIPNLGYSRHMREVRRLRFIAPPFELQESFSNRVMDTRPLLRSQISCNTCIDILYKCLLHRAFTGDLTAKWREAHMKELLAEMEQQAKALEAPPTPAQRAGSSAAVNRGR